MLSNTVVTTNHTHPQPSAHHLTGGSPQASKNPLNRSHL